MSSAIARNIFRMFSACCCSWVWVLNFDSLVTPSTRWATSAPNRSSMSSRLNSVSSGTSWRRAAWTAIGIDAKVGQDLGRCDRVGDVRLARRSGLAGVGLDREVERAARPAQGPPAGSAARGRRAARAEGLRRNACSRPVAREERRTDGRPCGRSLFRWWEARSTSASQDSSVPVELSRGRARAWPRRSGRRRGFGTTRSCTERRAPARTG